MTEGNVVNMYGSAEGLTMQNRDAVPPGVFFGGDEVPPGTFHSFTYYRTKDGLADYGFSFEQQVNGGWRAYIQSMPSYGSRNTGLHATHRLTDSGRYYVCYDPAPRSEADVRKVAALWANLTQEYIKTGRTIDEQMRRRQ